MKFLAGLTLSVILAVASMAMAAEIKLEEPKDSAKTPAAAPAAPEKAVDPETVVVKVNDKVIKEKDLTAEVEKRLAAQAKRMPPGMEINDWMRNQVRTSVVDMMVEQIILDQTLASKKLAVADEDIMKKIEEIATQQNLKMEDVPAEIAKFGMTMEDLKGQIRMSLQMDKLIDIEMKDKDVTDEDVKKFYDDNPQYFEKPEQVRAAHVLIMTQGKNDEEKAAAKTKAEGILKRAKAGEDFGALAKEFSEDPGSKDKGGEYTFPRGQMVKPFEDSAFGMKDGEISDLVETQYGYHIIKTLEHQKAEKTPLEEVKDRIKQHLTQQKRSQFWETYNKTLHDAAKIEYSDAEKKLREESARPPMMPGQGAQPQPKQDGEAKPQPKPQAAPETK
jgi:peptidyl-prolyl cis-trans isomerase C